MSLIIRKSSIQIDPSVIFWNKIEKLYGKIPKIIILLLDFNGFDSYLALKGIQWDDKQYFFKALEESVDGIADLDDSDPLKNKLLEELKANNQSIENFRLKLGHKNLIINLCNELQKTSVEDFINATTVSYSTVEIPDMKREQPELIVRQKQGEEEHGYSRDENEEEHLEISSPTRKRLKYDVIDNKLDQEVASPETNEQIQYIYETIEDDGSQYIDDQEFVDDEDGEILEYQEIIADDIDNENGIYSTSEQIVKTEAGNFERCYEISGFDSSTKIISRTIDLKNSKKPKHMYTEEFLQHQIGNGKFTPGRRRPKIQKSYPNTEEGLLEKWKDLIRQSCEVIVPSELLARFDLTHIEIVKIMPNIWEVNCPMCTKKVRLQMMHEGKYVNFKRSNFERHLRIVHYKQILVFKGDEDSSEMVVEQAE